MIDLAQIKFDGRGLVPAILQHANTGKVLTLAYMSRESLQITLEKKLACFYSRSRDCLWLKGETSGNYMRVVSVDADCDLDAILVRALPDGPACHTGEESCFFNNVWKESAEEAPFSMEALYALLLSRKQERPEGSYTTYLFEKGLDKILKKVGEEAAEVIIGAKNGREEAVYEIADLAYHILVLMAETDITPEDIRKELASRHVVDHKVKQEKMS